ncbi:MAG: class I SAM-dependent methyltransferase [Paracoccaceae bacterium]|nr:class I SAM-dependent methyltransferase [Paracoccaceae bacterium]
MQDYDEELQKAFLAHLPPPAKILDLGCGHGIISAQFKDLGHNVTSWDPSPEMQKVALARFAVSIDIKSFEDLSETSNFDGIYANFSLLHVLKHDLRRHLHTLKTALVTGGVLHMAMTLGVGETRDKQGRFYAYYSRSDLENALIDCGFEILGSLLGEEMYLSYGAANWVAFQSRNPQRR